MAVGRYVTDLDTGDVLGPIEFAISPFQVREYCHSVEMHQEYFQGSDDQIAPPTLVHLDKLRLYRHACPAGTGPTARVHYEFDAVFHDEIKVGEPLRVTGRVAERSIKRGREYVYMDIELERLSDGKPLVSYRDTVILAYRQKEQ
ncbi:conserved hypothetical protein [Hyphomicrobiales bacterium]|nr:conserved hypothetical protein [Hyphomicrobiales bacterium]CAH1691484.1 conserved hypothetical protein [Hyphomicrobiales bacterium]